MNIKQLLEDLPEDMLPLQIKIDRSSPSFQASVIRLLEASPDMWGLSDEGFIICTETELKDFIESFCLYWSGDMASMPIETVLGWLDAEYPIVLRIEKNIWNKAMELVNG